MLGLDRGRETQGSRIGLQEECWDRGQLILEVTSELKEEGIGEALGGQLHVHSFLAIPCVALGKSMPLSEPQSCHLYIEVLVSAPASH
jgi:hypothetical protein